MFPLFAGALIAAMVSSDDDEVTEEEVRRRLLGFGPPPRRRPEGGPSVLESWGVIAQGSLFTVDLAEGYVLRAFADADEAIEHATAVRKNDDHCDEIFVVEHVRVPLEIYEDLLLHGTDEAGRTVQIFDDGYEAGGAVSPYTSKVKAKPYWPAGLVWKWELIDEDFKDWPESKQREHRTERFYELRSEDPLPAGTRLYLRTDAPEEYLEEMRLQEEDEGETTLVEPAVLSDAEEAAPGDGEWIVAFEVEDDVPSDQILVVGGSEDEDRGRHLEMLSEVLFEPADPADEKFDPEYLAGAFAEHRGRLREVDPVGWNLKTLVEGHRSRRRVRYVSDGPEVLQIWVRPTEDGPTLFVVDPFQSRRLSLKVDSVRKVR